MTTEDYNHVLEEYHRHYEDLDYYVLFKVYEYRLECVVLPVHSIGIDTGKIYFRDAVSRFGVDTVTEVDKAEKFISGHVKWDGCSNWTFHTEQVMHHCCTRDDLTNIGVLLGRLYDEAKAKVPTFND